MSSWGSICSFKNNDGKVILSLTTAGCGCCSDNESTGDLDRAIILIEEHLEDLSSDRAYWQTWLDNTKAAGAIQETK